MKRISKLFAIALVFVAAFVLTGCGKKDEKGKYEEYIGYQFSGKDSWGTELAITLRTLEDDKLTFTYTDTLGDAKDGIMVYKEVTSDFKDGSASFIVKGDTEDKKYSFEYAGTITLKDGNVVVKLESGQVTENSSEGGSGSYQVGALEEASKTVTLTKVVDNS